MNSETSHDELFIEPQLGFSPSTLSRLLDLSIPALARDRAIGCLGSIPFVKVGRKVVYPKSAVQDWLKANLQRGGNSSLPLSPRSPGRPKGSTKAAIKSLRNTTSSPNVLHTEGVKK